MLKPGGSQDVGDDFLFADSHNESKWSMIITTGKLKAVIFDMDGLLLDTEKISLSTFIDSCRECGFDPDLQVYHRCIGTNYPTTRKILTDGYGSSFQFDAVWELWSRTYDEETIYKPVPLKQGALSLLQYLEKEGIRKVVVTSTRQDIARRMLGNADILHFFDFVLGGDQVSNSKPDPEIYLTACRKLGEQPSSCLEVWVDL